MGLKLMKRSLDKGPWLILVLIVLPLVIVAGLAFNLEEKQQQLFGHQVDALLESRLSDVDDQFQGHFLRLEQVLSQSVSELAVNPNSAYNVGLIRELIQRNPYIEQIFILDASQKLLYPSSDTDLRLSEKRFLERTQSLFQLPRLFSVQEELDLVPKRSEAEKSSPYSARLQISAQQELKLPSAPSHTKLSAAADNVDVSKSGWIAWFAESELQQVYWQQNNQGQVIGFALNPSRLVSDLINMLPDKSQVERENLLPDAAIRLVNNRGEQSYIWGQIAGSDENIPLLKKHSLSHPLSSWHVEYLSYGIAPAPTGWGGKLLWLLLTACVLGVLGWLVYREQTRAMRLAEQRVNFVSQISHELKTPLTNIRLYTEMLQDQVDENDTAERYLQVVDSESLRLTRLIDNVLNFSRLQKNVNHINRQPCDLVHCVSQCVDAFRPAFDQKGLSVRIASDLKQSLTIDAALVQQIINNLLSNCEKYAANGQFIDINIWRERSNAFVRVQDYGEGIVLHEQDKIFKPFYRTSNQLADGITGTGIGLSIARSLAENHGGFLKVEASAEGACFLLCIECGGEGEDENSAS